MRKGKGSCCPMKAAVGVVVGFEMTPVCFLGRSLCSRNLSLLPLALPRWTLPCCFLAWLLQ